MLIYRGMPLAIADELRAGGTDAYGKKPMMARSDGQAPCRCCLAQIDAGQEMLVLAYRPFTRLHAYTETGPVFLCKGSCRQKDTGFPEALTSPAYLLKGYSHDEMIVYGTGKITKLASMESYAARLLRRPDVAFVDIRSAKNNCWQARVCAAF